MLRTRSVVAVKDRPGALAFRPRLWVSPGINAKMRSPALRGQTWTRTA